MEGVERDECCNVGLRARQGLLHKAEPRHNALSPSLSFSVRVVYQKPVPRCALTTLIHKNILCDGFCFEIRDKTFENVIADTWSHWEDDDREPTNRL